MTARGSWRDAERAAARLQTRTSERRLLLLLARLPLPSERVLERLTGLRGGASLYRTLRSVTAAGLVSAIRPLTRPGHTPRLFYLTDLGLATVALDQGVDVRHLARRNRLDGAGLLACLPGLPQLLALHELLAALAAARPGLPDLLAWERPWRRRYQRPTAKAPVSVVLPAYAALAWGDGTGAYLLLPDLASFPLRCYRSTLGHLLILRGLQGGAFPTVVVVTRGHRRAAAWEALLEETRRQRAEAPLAVCLTTWDSLRTGLALPSSGEAGHQPAEALIERIQLPPWKPRQPVRPLPRLVGDALKAPLARPHVTAGLGTVALRLTSADRALLDVVGRHPFLPTDRLAIVLGWSTRAARQRRNRLIEQGLLRLVDAREAGPGAARLELVELTADGLALVAAQQGLTLGQAIRANGLAGGGPDQPRGARRMLLTHLAHTLGADGIVVSLIAMARQLAATGRDDAVLEWRNAAACSRRHLRPDGYGLYRHRRQLYGFFLEYDRGTMNGRDYGRKFTAYYTYWLSRRFEQDYDGFPTILVVTVDDVAEERIARAARAAAMGRAAGLPLLLTCRWRIDDPRNPRGLLGPIWREPDTGIDARRAWPLGPM